MPLLGTEVVSINKVGQAPTLPEFIRPSVWLVTIKLSPTETSHELVNKLASTMRAVRCHHFFLIFWSESDKSSISNFLSQETRLRTLKNKLVGLVGCLTA